MSNKKVGFQEKCKSLDGEYSRTDRGYNCIFKQKPNSHESVEKMCIQNNTTGLRAKYTNNMCELSNPNGGQLIPEPLEHKISMCRKLGGVIGYHPEDPYTIYCSETNLGKAIHPTERTQNKINGCQTSGGNIVYENNNIYCIDKVKLN